MIRGVHFSEEAWSWVCISLPAFWEVNGQGVSVKEALEEFFALLALQKAWDPSSGINASWQGGPVPQGTLLQHLYGLG